MVYMEFQLPRHLELPKGEREDAQWAAGPRN